jgi:hypothetical protein
MLTRALVGGATGVRAPPTSEYSSDIELYVKVPKVLQHLQTKTKLFIFQNPLFNGAFLKKSVMVDISVPFWKIFIKTYRISSVSCRLLSCLV